MIPLVDADLGSQGIKHLPYISRVAATPVYIVSHELTQERYYIRSKHYPTLYNSQEPLGFAQLA